MPLNTGADDAQYSFKRDSLSLASSVRRFLPLEERSFEAHLLGAVFPGESVGTRPGREAIECGGVGRERERERTGRGDDDGVRM